MNGAMHCVLCGGREFEVVLEGINADHPDAPRIPVLRCVTCELAASDSTAIAAAPAELYFEGYYGEKATGRVSLLVRLFQRERQFLALRGLKKGRILDVGCGDGTFLQNLPEGWHRFGYEPSDSGSKQLAIKGIPTVDLGAEGEPNEKFDVITLWQSFEHVERGLEMLRVLRKWLKPEGFIFLSVPNFASLQARAFGPRWFHLDPTRHLLHFRADHLRAVLQKAGWTPVWQSTFSMEYGVFGWWQSLFNVLPLEFNKGYKLIKARKKFHATARTLLEFSVYAVLSLPLAAVAGVLMLFETMLGRGGVIHVKARPGGAGGAG